MASQCHVAVTCDSTLTTLAVLSSANQELQIQQILHSSAVTGASTLKRCLRCLGSRCSPGVKNRSLDQCSHQHVSVTNSTSTHADIRIGVHTPFRPPYKYLTSCAEVPLGSQRIRHCSPKRCRCLSPSASTCTDACIGILLVRSHLTAVFASATGACCLYRGTLAATANQAPRQRCRL